MFEQTDKDEHGFTLIELLVVIIIIGILAAIAIPVFLNQRKKGYDSQVKSDIHNAVVQLETYAVDYNGGLPSYSTTGDTDMTTLVNNFSVGKSNADQSLVVRLTSGNGSASTVGYIIAGFSQSGKGFCYKSAASSNGVYTNTGAAAINSTTGC